MARSSASKYAENQFESATRKSFALMSEVLADTLPRATTAAAGEAAFGPVLAALATAAADWSAGESVLANAEAAQPGATLAFEDKLAGLRRKPDANSSSLLETWDTVIRGQVAYQGPAYRNLLPHGRETVTGGSLEQQLDALRDLGVRLEEQTGNAALLALGAVVTAFAAEARALRTAQVAAKGAVEAARAAQEALRHRAAKALYALIGQGMVTWADTPARVDTLWDVQLLRRVASLPPGAPGETAWDAPARTLSVAALPAGASRLEAWRRVPGGPPELLLTAAPGQRAVVLPGAVPFSHGTRYALWLVAVNSRGSSPRGPLVDWLA